MGGTGARCNLHVDMYDWTGTHALLTCRKIWRCLRPDTPKVHLGKLLLKNFSGLAHGMVAEGLNLFAHPLEGCQGVEPRGPNLRANPGAADLVDFWEVDQKAGEVNVLPSGWWHHWYYPEPSIGISSQFVTEADVATLVTHVMAHIAVRSPQEHSAVAECVVSRVNFTTTHPRIQLLRSCLEQLQLWENVCNGRLHVGCMHERAIRKEAKSSAGLAGQ